NVYIDNVVVEATPNCTEPSSLTVSNITVTDADLSWTASTPNPANGYQWEVRSSGVGGDPSPAFSGTTAAGVTAANVAGLMATTAYSLHVRSDCGSGSFSPWEGPEAFTTLLSIPPNDDCANAIALPACTGGSQAVGGTTVNSTVDANYVNCGAGGGSEGQRGVWYTLAGSNNQVT